MHMLKSRELRTQRAKLIADSREALKGEITAEVRAKVEKMDKDIDQLEKDIEIYEKQEKRERELAASTTDPVIDPTKVEPTAEVRKKQIEEETRKYSDAFYLYLREGESALSPEQRATLKKGWRNADKPEERAQTITTTGGGYVIPQGFQAELERAQKLYRRRASDRSTNHHQRRQSAPLAHRGRHRQQR
jgi:HK97 family phage major capsid protein